MKKILLTFVLGAFAATAVVAQQTQQPPAQTPQTQQTPTQQQPQKDMKKNQAEWDNKVRTELNLNAEQTTKYDAITKEYGPKFDALQNDATLSDDVRKERKMTLKKEKETKLNEFLTPEQQTKYREIHERKKEQVKPGS